MSSRTAARPAELFQHIVSYFEGEVVLTLANLSISSCTGSHHLAHYDSIICKLIKGVRAVFGYTFVSVLGV